ncbi:hypothetical protein MTR67_043629 [Solanum verrucosum]|uniref:Uncharacterized protein n=1 Tax=Solanum verrucosum TaxID=315347 RepID=A0AAF0UQM9_SOLVR|nr:hypothetical protein MTR67_043629 [Solanum verrucosum]
MWQLNSLKSFVSINIATPVRQHLNHLYLLCFLISIFFVFSLEY